MLWMGTREMFWNLKCTQYRRKSDWTCDTCSAPQSQQSPPPTRYPTPPTKQISDDSTFNVLQLNGNGIGNKLTEHGVVLERNKVKVAVIQESKLSPKSRTTPQCVRIVPMLQTAIVTKVSIRYPPGRTFNKS